MAGRGPAPKPPEQRRNTSRPRDGEWVQLPTEGRQGPTPSLPRIGFSRETRRWWKRIWSSPMATQWDDSDIPALIELAVLRERLMEGRISVASEVRLRSNQFGLTPEGRQQRRWVITEEDAERAGLEVTDELERKRVGRKKRLG